MPKNIGPIEQHLNEAFGLKIEGPPRPRALRSSGLPFCGILDTITPDEPEITDINFSLFVAMGTAAHEVVQLYMSLTPMGKDIWGSWKCNVCKKELKYQFRPDDCCNQPMHYDEVDFRVGPMTGHVDLVARYNNRWYCYEFKTTGPEPSKPKRMHLLQVRHYVAMMKKCFDIDVDGYAVVYIGRQYLERWIFGPYAAQGSIEDTNYWMFNAIKNFKAATKARKDPCRENLLEVVQTRPCKSKEDWNDYMSRAHQFQKSTCPLLSKCTSGTKKCLKAIDEMLNG